MAGRYKSGALASVHEIAHGLAEAGVMAKKTMKAFDGACLISVAELTPEAIRDIRMREQASQAVFARCLNVTPGLVSQWLQTSAEYTALILQTYNVAQRVVESKLGAISPDSLPPAVILDLDETVIDNSPFQVYLLKSEKTYNSELWKSWVEDGVSQATLIPGALSFIERMEELGVVVIYISNRRDSEAERKATIDTLRNLGIKTDEFSDQPTLRLLLKKDASEQETLRQRVVQKYNVVALIGDALGDFAAVFDPVNETTIESRRSEVTRAQKDWGSHWFVLPNPTYGALSCQ